MPTPTPVANLFPKARFQQSPDNITKHRVMVDSREFERGTDFAFLQYCMLLGASVKTQEAAFSAGLKLAGAVEFLSTLKMLGEVQRPLAEAQPANLDHKV